MAEALPRAVGAQPDTAAAYLALLQRLREQGCVACGARPLSIRNLLAFLFRLCGPQPLAPWTLDELLRRYAALRVECRTLSTVRAHAHWINLLLRSGGGAGPSCTCARLLPLLHTPPPLRAHRGCGERHAFDPEEVLRLHAAAAADPYDRLMLLIRPRRGPLPRSGAPPPHHRAACGGPPPHAPPPPPPPRGAGGPRQR